MSQPIPNFHPLSAMPAIAHALELAVEHSEEQRDTLRDALLVPHLLDDATVARVAKLFGESSMFVSIYEEQFARWQRDALTQAQARELTRLIGLLTRYRDAVREVLDIAATLKTKTIDAVMRRSDEDVALAVLSGELPDPRERSPRSEN